MGLYLLLLATFLAPLLTFFHECGHYVGGVAIDANPEFHVGSVHFRPHHPITNQAYFWFAAGGPLVTVLLATTGFLWLRQQRRPRIGTAPTRTDCVGIVLVASNAVLFAGLFVVHLILQDSLKTPGDAEKMSLLMGLPVWLVPALLASLSLVLMGATMRLFPRGCRFVPFGFAMLGFFTGERLQIYCFALWEICFN